MTCVATFRGLAFAGFTLVCLALWALPCPAASINIVLDASGSMAARLPSGERKIEAAKKAVAEVLAALPDADVVALRVYGHQSETSRHDCQDTAVVVPSARPPRPDRRRPRRCRA